MVIQECPSFTFLAMALGTRGDVQPILILSQELARHGSCKRAVFLTHEGHKNWLAMMAVDNSMELRYTPLPVVEDHQEPKELVGQVEHLAACLLAARAVAEQQFGGQAGKATGAVEHESLSREVPCSPTCEPLPSSSAHTGALPPGPIPLLLFNLFALEGFHMAEALGMRAVATHPYVIPYPMPRELPDMLREEYPELYQQLEGQGTLRRTSSAGVIHMAEVRHWMWPLFTEQWSALRQDLLGLGPVPGLRYKRTGESQRKELEVRLPPNVPLLYAFSEMVVPRPGYWPPSVTPTGFWLPRELHAGQSLPVDLVAFIEMCKSGPRQDLEGNRMLEEGDDTGQVSPPSWQSPICIDIGSMGSLGLVPDAEYTLQVLVRALTRLSAQGLLVAGSWTGFNGPYKSLDPEARQRLYLQTLPVPHEALFPHCSVVLHHGGSGTTARALTMGIPQVICPLQYDQFFWGERLSFLNLSPPPLDREVLFSYMPEVFRDKYDIYFEDPLDLAAGEVAGRLEQAVAPDRVQAQSMLRDLLAEEDGVSCAVEQVLEVVACAWN